MPAFDGDAGSVLHVVPVVESGARRRRRGRRRRRRGRRGRRRPAVAAALAGAEEKMAPAQRHSTQCPFQSQFRLGHQDHLVGLIVFVIPDEEEITFDFIGSKFTNSIEPGLQYQATAKVNESKELHHSIRY